MQLPVTIPLLRSWRLLGLLALAHAAALGTLLPLPWPWPARWATALLVAVSAFVAIERVWHSRITALHLDSKGELEVDTKVGAGDTARCPATILPQSMVLPGLVVLLLRVGKRRERLTLLTDATGATAHRQLRLWLRWRSQAANAG